MEQSYAMYHNLQKGQHRPITASTFPTRFLVHQKRESRSMVATIPFNLSAERNRSDSSNAVHYAALAREDREISWKIGGEIPLQTYNSQIWNDLAKRPQRLSSRCAFSEAMFQSFASVYAPSCSRLMAGG